MDRINNASSVNRRFIDEGNNRTIVPASHLNGLLFEIINVIEGFGGQLNGTEVAQIRTLLEARITSVSERLIEDFNVDEGNISDFAQAIQTILSSTIFDRDQISSSEIRTLVTNTFANFIYEQKVVQVANDSRVYSSSSASSNRYKAAIAFPSDLEFLPRTIFFELRIGTDKQRPYNKLRCGRMRNNSRTNLFRRCSKAFKQCSKNWTNCEWKKLLYILRH